MKYTLCITQECNLRCTYCYIEKKANVMTFDTAQRIVDAVFDYTPEGKTIDIGFFGGEPLLEFELVRQIADYIKHHPSYDPKRVEMDLVSNGTVFSDKIGGYLSDQGIIYCLSCDGPSKIQDKNRKFKNGSGSSDLVEKNIAKARSFFPVIPINAVYQPATLHLLPDVVSYFSSLGMTRIYLSPDFTAAWTLKDAASLQTLFNRIGEQYIDFYIKGEPHYISLIDSKLAVILKGGYSPSDMCSMGTGEFAFGPSGNIYPCERLIGSDDGNTHCIGNIAFGIPILEPCRKKSSAQESDSICKNCSLVKYCMNWCGCSNFFSTGDYERPGAFLCACEKAAIHTAFIVFEKLSDAFGTQFISQMVNSNTN